MRKIKKLLFSCLLVALVFGLSGCLKAKPKNDTTAIDGGVFKSMDAGNTWKQKTIVPTSGKNMSIAGLNMVSMAIDPSDEKAIYYGSEGNGLFYSYNGGDTWQAVTGLGKKTIRAIAIDAQDKCNIYVAIQNKIYKSIDCSRNWKQIYYDNQMTTTVNAVSVDHYNSLVVYAGLSRGDVMKSVDGGISWQTIVRAGDNVSKIVIDPNDSRRIFVQTVKKGILLSTDGGNNWDDLNKIMKDSGIGKNVKDLVLVKDKPEDIYIATKYGIIITHDKGITWEKLDLLPPDKKAQINAIAVNPKNTNEIFYITNTTFYRSPDGGQNWTTIKLPTPRPGIKILIDNKNPQIIYLGVRRVSK